MSPIPVYIVDCKGDCLVMAHEARDLAVMAAQGAVLAVSLVLVCLGGLLLVAAFRR